MYRIQTIFTLVTFVLVFWLSGCSEKKSSTTKGERTTITATTLVNEYKNSAGRAAEKYRGKVLTVRGVFIKSHTHRAGADVLLGVHGTNKGGIGIVCVITSQKSLVPVRGRTKDFIVVKGRVAELRKVGEYKMIYLRDCSWLDGK